MRTTQVIKGEMSAKTTYQRSAKGPVSISECSADGTYVALENTGRKVSQLTHCSRCMHYAATTHSLQFVDGDLNVPDCDTVPCLARPARHARPRCLSSGYTHCCCFFLPRDAMLSAVYAVVVCLSVCVCVCVCVCLSHSGIVSKRLNVGSRK